VRTWLEWLIRGRSLELACALALGYALALLANDVANVPVLTLAQHVATPRGDGSVAGLLNLFSTGTYLLNFKIGSTVVFYGDVLSATLAVALVGLTAVFIVRLGDRKLATCAFCASRIPHGSSHCAYCGSGVTPSEP
jgi:hypothetical protein